MKKTVIGVVVVVLILLTGLGIALWNKSDSTTVDSSAAFTSGAVRFGPSDGNVVVTVIEDFACPHCKDFEANTGSTLAALVTEGVTVDYLPISILDRASSTRYSTRAASAAYCLADADPANWVAWHDKVFERQPAEGGAGLSDATLISIARDAGIEDPAVADCINTGAKDDFVTKKTAELLDAGVSHTPTVLVNGTEVDATPNAIRAAVAAAS